MYLIVLAFLAWALLSLKLSIQEKHAQRAAGVKA
jgi:hypothetical protein